ncbi:ADP-ribosylglycohydrolase family protein [Kitasatospora sp. NPDC059827]|uniref:ADP-ribosylglycohydrolase family protein n=1 Tax=Kitasatospora sp. NPDC059827 TaxID=3346964 RepID=UPI003665218B
MPEIVVDEGRVRGLVLGAALGDAAGVVRGRWPAEGPLRVGVGTQLAAFTIEGAIRASVRMSHKGICHAPSVVWHAYCRWAFLQGIEPARIAERWTRGGGGWPDGWLARVPALRERRGSAPATVAALTGLVPGSPTKPVTGSRGAHALTRGLALGLVHRLFGPTAGEVIRGTAALTHGAPDAQEAALGAAWLVSRCLAEDDPFRTWTASRPGDDHPVDALVRSLPAPHSAGPDVVLDLLKAPAAGPDPGQLAWIAPEATASSALLGALLVVSRFPGRDTVDAALRFAAGAPDGSSVAATAGALLGAAHGVDALPVELLSRLELAWVLDTLARDLLQQYVDSPGGGEYVPARDPHWWDRYPRGVTAGPRSSGWGVRGWL